MLSVLSSCGGSSNPLSIAITTNPGTIAGGSTYIFQATTTNSTSQGSGVTWTLALNEASNGNTTTPCDAQCGSIINTGTTTTSTVTSGSTTYYDLLTTTSYIAPLDPPNPNSLILTATAVGNSSLTETVTFTIGAPAIVVKIPNKITTIAPGAAPVTLTANVQFDTTNAGVSWTLKAGGAACSPACGSLSSAEPFTVVYTPPATLPAAPNNTPTITATSVTTATSSDFDTFTIEGSQQAPVSVQITNPFTNINAGSTGVTIDATVTNDEQSEGVTWTLSPTTGTGALSASTATSVLYTPPNQASQPPNNTPTITATSVADPTKFASFTFTIEPAGNIAACTLSGSYAFALSGQDSTGQPLAALGRISIDSGKITAGSLDVNDNFQSSHTPALAGTCRSESLQGFAGVESRGVIAFDSAPTGFAQAPQFEYMIFRGGGSAASGTLREIDAGKAQSAGTIYLQDVAAADGGASLNGIAPAGGDFSLQLTDVGASPARTLSGQFQLAFRNGVGTIAGGTASVTSDGRTISSGIAWSGTATAPDNSGRGTLTFNFAKGASPSVGPSQTFIYTIVTPKIFLLLQSGAPASPPERLTLQSGEAASSNLAAGTSPSGAASLQLGAATQSP